MEAAEPEGCDGMERERLSIEYRLPQHGAATGGEVIRYDCYPVSRENTRNAGRIPMTNKIADSGRMAVDLVRRHRFLSRRQAQHCDRLCRRYGLR